MESISLDNNFKLSFDKLPHAIRLIVSKNNEEWVCRNEKLKNLLHFTRVDNEHLFKGRLQLFKNEGLIKIQVKNEVIGVVSSTVFKEALGKLK